MGTAQARLLKGATVLVNQRGLDDLSMSELAQNLKVRTPTLYSHVAGIDDLKRLLPLHGRAELGRAMARATIGKSGPDAVRALPNAYRYLVEKDHGTAAATVA